jgi:uncharacterized protein YndB with AHSA1/START domain
MTSLTLVRRIAARPALVFEALVAPDQMRQWWGPDAGPVLLAETDPRLGGGFRVVFRMLDGSEHESAGTYLEFDPPHRLAMSWRWLRGGGDDGESRVEVSLRPIDTGTELTFTHARLGDDAARDSHRAGWTGALDKLEALFPTLE